MPTVADKTDNTIAMAGRRMSMRHILSHLRPPGLANLLDWFSRLLTWRQSQSVSARLNLLPWEVAPCDLTDDDLARDHRRGGHFALALLERMKRCGVSRWHPDPVAACEEAERRAAL
jgi:hypothetical protein